MKGRSFIGDGLSLSVASVVNGGAAYAFAVVGARYLGAAAFSDVSVAWSFWALTAAMITLPVQHWLTWRAEIDGGLEGIRGGQRRLIVLGVATSVLIAGVAFTPGFFSAPLAWAVLVGGLGAGSWLLGWGRGMLAARGDYQKLSFVIAGENLVRLGALLAIIVLDLGVFASGAALLTGPLILLAVFSQVRIEPIVIAMEVPVLRSIFALSGAMALAQALLQLGPAAAAWLGQPDITVTATFSTFAIFRAPVLVLLVLTSRITAPMTKLVADRATRSIRRFVNGSLVVTVIAAGLVGAGAYRYGRPLIELFFGRHTALPDWETGLVASGMVLGSLAVVHLILFLSSSRSHEALAIWSAASLIGLVILVTVDRGPVSVAFFASELAAVAAGTVAHRVWLH